MIGLEERIYRFRCVEGWAMVVPWLGFPVNKILEIVDPDKDANYVRFETFYDPKIAPGQKQSWYLGHMLRVYLLRKQKMI